MSRRNRILVWLIGIITLLVLVYASLPRVLTTVVTQALSGQGFSDIQLRVGYPGWHGIRVRSFTFTAMAGDQQFVCEVPEVNVTYDLTGLMMGAVARVHIPAIEVRSNIISGRTKSESASAGSPPVALLSGQWLAVLPVRELVLGQLKVHGQVTVDTVYTLQLSGRLHDAQLDINGDVHLSSLQKPIAFVLNASHTGKTYLSVSDSDEVNESLLMFRIDPVAVGDGATEPGQVELGGVMTASLSRLMPLLAEGLSGMNELAGLEGDMTTRWQAQFNNANWRIKGEAAIRDFGGRWGEQLLPRVNLTTPFDATPRQISFKPMLDAGNKAVVLEAKGDYQIPTGIIQAEFSLHPVIFSESGFVLSRLLDGWTYPFDISSGQLRMKGKLNWQERLEMQAALQLDKLGGNYNQIAFAGISGATELFYDDGLHGNSDSQLQVDLVDVGFQVKNMEVRFALETKPGSPIPVVRIKKFAARLLGGSVRIRPFKMDFGREKNAFVVQLDQIALNQILALEQQEGLEGSGVLDGKIPIEIVGKQVVVTRGRLAARTPGGVIRYTPTEKVAAVANSNPAVGMVVGALSNFQYETLDVKSDYKPGGDLLLQVRLEGRNPAWQAGRPVHLNLNVEENIPALLRSLQLGDAISERMLKYYQEGAH